MRYEIKKIFRTKAVWIVLLVLIVSDLFLLKAFSSEQYTAEVYPKEKTEASTRAQTADLQLSATAKCHTPPARKMVSATQFS